MITRGETLVNLVSTARQDIDKNIIKQCTTYTTDLPPPLSKNKQMKRVLKDPPPRACRIPQMSSSLTVDERPLIYLSVCTQGRKEHVRFKNSRTRFVPGD